MSCTPLKLILWPLLLILTGCVFHDQTATNREETALRHLKLQQLCSEAGRKYWIDNKAGYELFLDKSAKETLDYMTHYNSALNKCLVEVDRSSFKSGSNGWTDYYRTILDAFEGYVVADEYTHSNHSDWSVVERDITRDGKVIHATDANLKWFHSLMTDDPVASSLDALTTSEHKAAASAEGTALAVTPPPASVTFTQRFQPIGMSLSRVALDTKTGQQCRTAPNAPPAFQALPMCADLVREFPQ